MLELKSNPHLFNRMLASVWQVLVHCAPGGFCTYYE